jgi:hypothetical protein
VIQHAPLWRALGPENPTDGPIAVSCRCEESDATYDQWDAWMEFQAKHMSGALLMPKSRVFRLAERLAESKKWKLPVQGRGLRLLRSRYLRMAASSSRVLR